MVLVDSSVIDKVCAVAEPVGLAEGVEVVDIEIANVANSQVLRVFIDKEGGVTVEDCARVSKQLGLVLEAEDIIKSEYTLEVSSLGLIRKLKKPLDFQRSIGKLAMVKVRGTGSLIAGKALVYIEAADGTSVTVKLKDSDKKATLRYSDIARANLEIEF